MMKKRVVFFGWMFFLLSANAGENLVRNGGFEEKEIKAWAAPEHVGIKVVEVNGASGKKALKVEWTDVVAFEKWAQKGGLLKNVRDVLKSPLLRDTRYRLSCRIKVERFEVSEEAKAYLKSMPKGQFDPATIVVGAHGGHWNSGMPFMAYDISKLGSWQDLQSEFVTSYTGTGGFNFFLDAYPHYRPPMKSSGVLYLDDIVVEAVKPRVGFTRVKIAPKIDGDLSDWWKTNPVVITRDMVVGGEEAENRSASGIVYTMWDDEKIYVAAKVIDDVVGDGDELVIALDGKKFVVSGMKDSGEGIEAVVLSEDKLGTTTNMYRIVSQYGDAVDGLAGYVVEAAIPYSGEKPQQVAFEIRDRDEDGRARVLRFPRVKGGGEMAETAFANEKGELRGGDYPVYAITDAGNPRDRERMLAVKNVASHLTSSWYSLGYPIAVFKRRSDEGAKPDSMVSWTTNMPASGFIEIGKDQNYGTRIEATDAVGEKTGNAMRVILRDMDGIYHYRVGAKSVGGEDVKFSKDHILTTIHATSSRTSFAQVPLTLISFDGSSSAPGNYPVTSGVPFPKGQLQGMAMSVLDSKGKKVEAQFEAISKWPDGSIRWLLVDFQSQGGVGEKYTLQTTGITEEVRYRGDPPQPEGKLRVKDETDQIKVDTGAIQFEISKINFNLFDEVSIGDRVIAGEGRLVMVDDGGVEYVARKPDVVEVEELGPVRVCIRVAGKYVNAEGEPFFDYEVRYHAYSGSSTVRVNHNYTVRLKERIDPAEGKYRPSNPQPVKIRSMSMELPLLAVGDGKARVGIGEQQVGDFAISKSGLKVRQKYENEAFIAGKKITRIPGWMEINGVAAGVRQFSELYPKALSVRSREKDNLLRISTLPPIEEADYPSEEGSIEDYVWGYLRGGRYRLRRGEGRSHDVMFDFNVKPQDIAEAGARLVAQPLFAAASPEWYCNSGVIGKVQPKGEPYADYDFAFDQGIKQMSKSQQAEPFFGKRFGRLGLRNFGDSFGSDGMNWDNVEYDLGYSCLQQFMRTGNADALRMGQDIVLHNMNVDIAKIRDGYEWPGGHTGDHSVKIAGLGHTWCEGLWNYYFLTGDRHAARKALGVSNTIAHQVPSLMAAGTPGVGGGRTYGWSVVGLMAAYGATSDPLYLNAAKEVEEVAVRTQHPFRGGWLHRLSPGHCFHAPAHTGRVYFMHEIVLAGQTRFHQLTGDPNVAQCLQNAVNGLVGEFNQQRAAGLPGGGYTSCPFLTFPGKTHTAASLSPKHSFGSLRNWEAVYYVDASWPEPSLHQSIKTMLGEGGPPRFNGPLSSQGKFFAQGTRWTPNRIYWILKSGQGE